MKIKELVQSVKDSTPALAGIPDGKAVALLRAAFQQISAEIESTAEGVVKVGGLGQFRVRQVEREKGDEKVTVKVVGFRKAVPKAKGEASEE